MSNVKLSKTSEDMFDSLVNNAIDFLNHSVNELEFNPKYSVINFYNAIELFLKARLMLEHWSLIVSKPDKAVLNKFIEGNFQSVGMQEAIQRLGDIVNQTLSKEEQDCFNQIRVHRNRLVHFFHPDYATKPNTKTLQNVVAEQCKGWFYLHRLLTSNWLCEFQQYSQEIENLNVIMHKQREFLRTKYEILVPKIIEKKSKGIGFVQCFSCGFEASEVQEDQLPLVNIECLVCGIQSSQLKVACPNCRSTIFVEDLGEGKCDSCGEEIDIHYLTGLFDPRSPREQLVGEYLAYCSECEQTEEPTVIPFGDKWLCLFCQSIHNEVDHCHWCGSFVTGYLEDSAWSGCGVICEGRAGEGFPD